MTIYKITNKINGKIYVGKTKNSPKMRFGSHKSTARTRADAQAPIYRAIRKYGEENFEMSIIDTAKSLAELKSKEFYWIKQLNSTDESVGYNILYGDEKDNMIIDKKTRIKLVETRRTNKRNGNFTGRGQKRTKYVGVYFIRDKQLWSYAIKFNGFNIVKKRYSTAKNAAIGRDIKLLETFPLDDCLPLMNFPNNVPQYREGTIKDKERDRKIECKSSKYLGVNYDKVNNLWTATIVNKGKRIKRGGFKEEEKAAETADYIKVKNGSNLPLNFPNINYANKDYQPPKTVSESFKYPKYIGLVLLKDGKERYRVKCVSKKIDEYFDTLEEATKFQQAFIK